MSYGFFDYKYNIAGYHGQHYGSVYQIYYLVGTLVLAFLLAFLLRKVKKQNVTKAVGIIGIAITVLYVVKLLWESHYDVASGMGFNTFILPFDTCSILMWASLLAGFCRGWFGDWAKKWLCTLGFAGGFANALFLQALKYYPFFSFGALYSMLWHATMIFVAWWLLLSGTVRFTWKDIFRSFGFHLIFSVLPIAINFCVSHMDWMLYDSAGGVPLIEDLCRPFANTWVATLIMLGTYLAADAALALVYILLGKVFKKRGC